MWYLLNNLAFTVLEYVGLIIRHIRGIVSSTLENCLIAYTIQLVNLGVKFCVIILMASFNNFRGEKIHVEYLDHWWVWPSNSLTHGLL